MVAGSTLVAAVAYTALMSSNPINPRKRRFGETSQDPVNRGMPAGKDTMAAQSPPEQTPWQLYNEKAINYDREMIKEWEDDLSILLLFVSLNIINERGD